MSLPVVEQHYAAQVRQEEATAVLARRQWRRMGADDLDRSWSLIVDRLLLMITSGQLGAARAGAAYIASAVDVEPSAQVNPAAWAGVASDGRPLDTLLYSAVVHTKARIGAGEKPEQALTAGGAWLDMITRTQVADASRGAAGAAITARARVGYVRYVSPPCCQRCAVLAGKFFRWNAGFQRHPRCDCRHYPVAAGEHPDAAAEGFRSMIKPDDVKDLTIAQRAALADGADLNQVLNAHRRGARSADGMTTTEGTTRRGYASYIRRAVARQRAEATKETVSRSAGGRNVTRTQPRLTPEAIYRVAASRDEALRLLKLNGYVVGDIRQIAASAA